MANYDPQASYDLNDNDDDPSPRYDPTNENKSEDNTYKSFLFSCICILDMVLDVLVKLQWSPIIRFVA